MIEAETKYITFDCYGTLTAFGLSAVTRPFLGNRVTAERMEDCLDDFEARRPDEGIGVYKPHNLVLATMRRTAEARRNAHRESDSRDIDQSVPTYGLRPDHCP